MATDSDNFNRVDSASPGAQWTSSTAFRAQILTNQMGANQTGDPACEWRNTLAVGTDQFAECLVGDAADDTADFGIGPAIRIADAADTCYWFLYNASDKFRLVRVAAGTIAESLGTYNAVASIGDLMRIEATGTSIKCYVNGVLRISATNGTLTSGRVGIRSWIVNLIATVDNFNGGDLASTFSYVFQETFEGNGYQNTGWTESIGAGGVVGEDEPTDNAGFPRGWESQCLKITHASGTASSTTHAVSPSLGKSFTSLEVRVSAESLSDGQNNTIAKGQTTAGAQDMWLVRIAQASGVVSIEAVIYYDGSAHTVWSQVLVMNQTYRFEFNWDSISDLYTLWVNGMMVGAGSLTSSAAGWQFDTILLGDAGSSGGSTYRLDNFIISEAYIGPSVEFDMAWVTGDRIKETTTTTGTGDITLGGAVSGYQAFSAVAADQDQIIYAIVGTTEWEVGLGRWNTGGTLTRLRVFSSSNSGALVNFSAGTKNVFVPIPAAQAGTPVTNTYQKFNISVPPDGSVRAEGEYEIASGMELDLAQDAVLEVG